MFWDDLAHLLAFVSLVLHGALSLADEHGMAALKAATNPKAKTSQADLLAMYQRQAHLSAATNCFLYSVFWLVKLGFLLFYYRLFSTSTTFKRAWWVVLAFTLLTFWVPIGGVIAICGSSHTIAEFGESVAVS